MAYNFASPIMEALARLADSRVQGHRFVGQSIAGVGGDLAQALKDVQERKRQDELRTQGMEFETAQADKAFERKQSMETASRHAARRTALSKQTFQAEQGEKDREVQREAERNRQLQRMGDIKRQQFEYEQNAPIRRAEIENATRRVETDRMDLERKKADSFARQQMEGLKLKVREEQVAINRKIAEDIDRSRGTSAEAGALARAERALSALRSYSAKIEDLVSGHMDPKASLLDPEGAQTRISELRELLTGPGGVYSQMSEIESRLGRTSSGPVAQGLRDMIAQARQSQPEMSREEIVSRLVGYLRSQPEDNPARRWLEENGQRALASLVTGK